MVLYVHTKNRFASFGSMVAAFAAKHFHSAYDVCIIKHKNLLFVMG